MLIVLVLKFEGNLVCISQEFAVGLGLACLAEPLTPRLVNAQKAKILWTLLKIHTLRTLSRSAQAAVYVPQ